MGKCEGCNCQRACGGDRDFKMVSLYTGETHAPEEFAGATCYLAGKMAGEWRFGEAAFVKGAASLRAFGVQVISPFEIDIEKAYIQEADNGDLEHSPSFDYETVLGDDLKIVDRVAFVALLPGWRNSPGANREVDHARSIGVPAYEIVWG